MGIFNASGAQWYGYTFMLFYNHLKLSLLLHETVFVTFLLASTVTPFQNLDLSIKIPHIKLNLHINNPGHWTHKNAYEDDLGKFLWNFQICTSHNPLCVWQYRFELSMLKVFWDKSYLKSRICYDDNVIRNIVYKYVCLHVLPCSHDY